VEKAVTRDSPSLDAVDHGGLTNRAERRSLVFWLLAVALWGIASGSDGIRPYELAVFGSRRPADFGRDFVAASVRLADGAVYAPAVSLAYRHHALLGVREGGTAGPFYAHTPAAALLVSPLVILGFRVAALVWLGVSIAMIAVLATVLVGVLAGDGGRSAVWSAAAFTFILLWPPTLYNLEKGQWSLMLAALIAVGWRALVRDRPGRAGAAIGLACTLKLTPAVVFPYLLLRRRRAAAAFAIAVAVLVIASVAAIGIAPWTAFLDQAPANVAFWEDRLENAASVTSLTTRLFVPGRFTYPLFDLPMTGRLIAGLITVILVGTALLLTWRVPVLTGGPLEGPVFALWCVLAVLLNPLGWLHSAILLLLPAALVLRATGDPALSLRPSTRLWLGIVVALAIALVSLPRDSLRALALPVPVTPGRVLVSLALPCYGAFALFAAAALLVRHGRPRDAGPQ
jgi:hypothetical protein